MGKTSLQSHNLFHNAVAHFHRPHQHQQVEHQLPDVAPHGGDGGNLLVHRRGRRRHDGEDDAGQGDDGPLQTHPGVGAEEVLPHAGGGLPRKTGERNRGDGGVQ